MKFLLRASISTVLPLLLCATAGQNALAQNLAPKAEQAEAALEANLERGGELLDANDVRAVEVLRAASQAALAEVGRLSTLQTSSNAANTSLNARVSRARETAADAHYLWGRAADQFARRDEAMTAYARAISLGTTPGPIGKAPIVSRSSREARAAIGGLLRGGLPLLAPDDALETIARVAQGGLWTPRRFSFALPPSIAPPSFAAPKTASVEFLTSSGKMFPPENTLAAPGTSRLTRVPPLFRAFNPDSLPPSLQMDRVAMGYARETVGPNRGLWRQVVRVFYASNFGTKGNRDDRARAETLCEMFLKTWATNRAALGVENPYVRDGVSTLWLMEVSSVWPDDDDDPIVRSQLPPKMPTANTPLENGGKTGRTEVEVSPLSRPWRASAQMDAALGEILFFKAGFAREESEWLRETMHELGHVSLAPFNGFAPPLEPFGNGALGETLDALWASASPEDWAPSESLRALLGKTAPRGEDEESPPASTVEFDRTLFARALDEHAQSNALSAFVAWKKAGPFSALRRDNSDEGLRYLAGTALFIERVWGAPTLGAAMKTARAKNLKMLRADDLLNAFAEIKVAQSQSQATTPNALGNPIWLGGALDEKIDVAALRERHAVGAKSQMETGAWLWVPPGARGLRVFFTALPDNKIAPNFTGNNARGTTRVEKGGYSSLVSVGTARGWTKWTFQSNVAISVGLAQWEK